MEKTLTEKQIYHRDYRRKNRERINKREREYYCANKDKLFPKLKEYQKKYFQERYYSDPEFRAKKLKENMEYRKLHPKPKKKAETKKCSQCDNRIYLHNKSGLCRSCYGLFNNHRQYYANREKYTQRNKEYREKNREIINANARKKYWENLKISN